MPYDEKDAPPRSLLPSCAHHVSQTLCVVRVSHPDDTPSSVGKVWWLSVHVVAAARARNLERAMALEETNLCDAWPCAAEEPQTDRDMWGRIHDAIVGAGASWSGQALSLDEIDCIDLRTTLCPRGFAFLDMPGLAKAAEQANKSRRAWFDRADAIMYISNRVVSDVELVQARRREGVALAACAVASSCV
jgi:hypothetical protein